MMSRQQQIEFILDQGPEAEKAIRVDVFDRLKQAGLIIPDDQDSRPVVTDLFMCKVDFECELGMAAGGNVVYGSVEELRERRKCVDACGIVEVECREVRVVQESNYGDDDDSVEEPGKDNV